MSLRVLAPAAVGLAAGAVLAVVAGPVRVQLSIAPALLAAVAGVLATALLLAARRRRDAEAVRRQAAVDAVERSRRRFVRRLDHELKNPLTALLAALPEPGVAREQADRIRRLLADLRRVADVETAELDRSPVDIAEVLREAVDSATADTGGGRTVRVDVPAAPWPLPAVSGDADLLLVALYNLVANALKYTAPGDVIEVRAREAGPSVVVEIADTGPGIPADEQDVVWEELARGRSAGARPGSGIGLSLVRVIAARHGGSAGLRSREGAGTSVHLTLPVAGREPDGGAGAGVASRR